AALLHREGGVAASSVVALGPRIALQPATLQLADGEARDWTVLSMDLEGLQTPKIQIRYDPTAVQVIQAFPGDAIVADSVLPVVASDPSRGMITMTSGDDTPLRFRSGGQLLALKVRGTGAGESFVVLEPVDLTDANGATVDVVTNGGRVAVR
ncbi:MAG TPA: hypothetical protein VGE86_00170, partial [Thermoanaerobaculia bacterium]